MPFVTLSAQEIERLLPMGACIDVMARALVDLERGELSQPLRSVFMLPGAEGGMAWMPAHRSGPQAVFGVKVLCVMPGNPARGLDSHQGQVLLADGETGQLRAVLDASAVTAIRTAAVSALATRLLARTNARVLAIIGTGVQARKHLESIPLVRPIARARVAGRTPEDARKFALEAATHVAFPIEAAENAESAVRDADIVVTATSSATPVLAREWLAPGVHVNAIGASRPTEYELDLDTIAAAFLFTDRRESIEHEAGEYRLAVEKGRITDSHVRGELGELLTGKRQGRTSDDQLTLFRSLGLAVEDLAAAEYVLARATERGSGITVAF
jgi:ornithine cyclodeaminase/alanine dehydrogenase-like protein (mu-crystallin family)